MHVEYIKLFFSTSVLTFNIQNSLHFGLIDARMSSSDKDFSRDLSLIIISIINLLIFFQEAAKLYEMAAECHAIALSVQASAPIVPFSTIPLAFE